MISQKQCHTVAQDFFSGVKNLGKFQRVTPNGGAKQRWGRLKRQFSTNISLYLEMVQDRDIVTMEG